MADRMFPGTLKYMRVFRSLGFGEGVRVSCSRFDRIMIGG